MYRYVTELEEVFEQLQRHGLKIKISSRHFQQNEVKVFRHMFNGQGIQTDPAKIEAITRYPVPADVRALRSFLGLSS